MILTSETSGARGLPFALACLLALSACSPEAEPVVDPAPAPDDDIVERASSACMGQDVDAVILQLDSLIEESPRPDAYAVRAGCLRWRFAKDSVRADAEAAFEDLGRAIEASGDSSSVALDVLYNQRAFTRLTLSSSDFEGMLADLDEAVLLAPESVVHRSDRSIARAMAGDRAGAREDLEWLLARPDLDSARTAEARQRLSALE